MKATQIYACPSENHCAACSYNSKTHGQTKKGSFIEAAANVVLGYSIMVIAQRIIFPWFGIDLAMSTNLKIGLCFTVVSLIRSYVLRRLFNSIKL
tara:strand:- start:182 stop:466 length:285 start_codon:yes stop_codon:yes gene_type:complete